MNSIDKFRTKVDAKQTELILRKLVKRQEDGEIRTDDELRAALAEMLKEVSSAGFITLEIPVRPWNKMESERFQKFFEDLGMDIETLFVEVDHTEDVLGGLTQNVITELQKLRFALGNLRSEIVSRRLRRSPGSGWSTILRDSFDSGYGKLLGRAELTVDLFKDERSGYTQNNEGVPIRSDARIQGVAKKLTLPETGSNTIGFKRSQLLWEAGTTSGNIAVDNNIETYRMIDGQSDTFWSFTIGSEYPFLGIPQSDITQIAGTELSGNVFNVNLSGIQDPQAHEYFLRIIGFSGTFPQYVCLSTPEDFAGPTCSFDLGHQCQWNYTNQYSTNCANRNCSRYTPELLFISGLAGVLEDGYRYNTGAIVNFQNLSGIYAGQTWRIGIEPSGVAGAKICLELTLTKPTKINWLEIDPVVTSPFSLSSVEFTRRGDTTRQHITASSVQVLDRIRLDFAAIEAEKIYLTLLQETYEVADLHLRPRQQAIQKISDLMTRVNAPSIEEFYNIGIESVVADFLPNGPLQRSIENRSTKPIEINGNFYTFGLFEVNCGLTSYSDTAIAIARETRVLTPRMFGVQSNLEPDISYVSGMDPGSNGTVEFSAVKFNYDKNNSLINIDDFPVPVINASGTVTERLFIDNDKQGYLRFAARLISGVQLVNENRDIDVADFTSEDINTPVLKTRVIISDPAVTEDSILLVTYTPAFGVFLNEGRTLSIEDNTNQTLSLSDVPALIVAAAKTSNRDIQYSDVFLRIILRRNDLDIYSSPGLRDYQFLVGESDEGRFF